MTWWFEISYWSHPFLYHWIKVMTKKIGDFFLESIWRTDERDRRRLPDEVCRIWQRVLDDAFWALLFVELWLLFSSWLNPLVDIVLVRSSVWIRSGLDMFSCLSSFLSSFKWFFKPFCSRTLASKLKNEVLAVEVAAICTLLFVVNSKPALWIGLNVLGKLFPTVNWLSGWSSDANGLGGVVRICDVLRRYRCPDGDVVLARDSVRGVFEVVLFSSMDLFCWSWSKSCALESTSAKEMANYNG